MALLYPSYLWRKCDVSVATLKDWWGCLYQWSMRCPSHPSYKSPYSQESHIFYQEDNVLAWKPTGAGIKSHSFPRSWPFFFLCSPMFQRQKKKKNSRAFLLIHGGEARVEKDYAPLDGVKSPGPGRKYSKATRSPRTTRRRTGWNVRRTQIGSCVGRWDGFGRRCRLLVIWLQRQTIGDERRCTRTILLWSESLLFFSAFLAIL